MKKNRKLLKEVLAHGANLELFECYKNQKCKLSKSKFMVFNGKVLLVKNLLEVKQCAIKLFPYKLQKVELMSHVGLVPNV